MAASFAHHVHNAVFLADYPNMPASITVAGVYGAWLAQTAVGLAGLLLFLRGWRRSGLALIGLYAGFGFYGLLHYTLAPMAAHTPAMNLSIGAEVLASVFLLYFTVTTFSWRR